MPAATVSELSLSVTPAVSSSAMVSVTSRTVSLPAVAVSTTVSLSSSRSSSTMATSAVAEVAPSEIVNAAGSV